MMLFLVAKKIVKAIFLNCYQEKMIWSRPPVANVDQGVIVTSLVEPNFSYNLLDRFPSNFGKISIFIRSSICLRRI